MNKKIYDLTDRTFKFAQRVLEIASLLPENLAGKIICNQFVKSGTSIGANVEEADGAGSKADFVSKLTIARKEAKETKYWLKLSSGKYIKSELISGDVKECEELIKILSAIISKTK